MRASQIAVLIVAIIHFVIAFAEMFLWTPLKLYTRLGLTPDQGKAAAKIVANAGLYNGFIACGLLWSALGTSPDRICASCFFLGCVAVAGVFGAVTLSPKTLLLQTLPALAALYLVWSASAHV